MVRDRAYRPGAGPCSRWRRPRAVSLPLAAIAAAAAAAGAPRSAVALGSDAFEVFVAQSFIGDDNVFRLPDNVDVEPLLGTTSRSDSYQATAFGLDFDVPVSGQRIVGDLALERARFGRFASLDHTARSGRAAWLWQAGRRFAGQLEQREELILGSFANLQGGIQSRAPNFIESSETLAEIGYQIAPQWELSGTLSEERHTNTAPEFQVSNARIYGRDLMLSYVARSGNRIGLNIETEDAELPRPQLVAGTLVDNSYDQRTVSLLTDWTITAQSRVDLRLGRATRDYPGTSTRDFSAWVVRAAYEWSPVEHFSMTASFERDISATEEINVGFVFVERYVLRPAWRLTEQLEIAANLGRSERRHLGDPGLQALEPGGAVTEHTRLTELTVSWAPTRVLRLDLNWRREGRDAALARADYDAEIMSLGIRAVF